jgi:tetratricopeptide (TPR) repeat protein
MSMKYEKSGNMKGKGRMNEKLAEDVASRIIYLMQVAQSLSQENSSTWIETENILRETVILADELSDNDEYEEFINDVISSYLEFSRDVAQLYLVQQDIFNPLIALEFLHRTLDVDETDAQTWLDIGTAHAYLGQNMEALKSWQKALKYLDPTDSKDKENIEIIEINLEIMRTRE